VKKAGVGPIIESMLVPADRDVVWRALTEAPGEWWPLPAVSATGVPVLGLHLELVEGGRLAEVWADGTHALWATVLGVEAPSSLTLSWNPGGGSAPATTVEVRLDVLDEGTRVRVRHSGWEALGEEPRMDYVAGWPFILDRLELYATTR